MFREYWINMSLLSGQWTHTANLLSAYVYATLESGVELAVSPFSKDVSTKAALQRFSGMLSGLQMGIANAGKAWRTEQPQLGHQMQMDVQNRRAIPGKLGRAVRTAGRALMAADEFNKAIFYVGELHRLATDESIETGRPFKEVLASYGNNQEKQAEAIKWAERLLFQTQLGSFGRQAMALRDKAGPLGWLLFPFVKTPTNIVKRFGEYAGPLALTMPSVRADIAAGGRNRALSIGRMAMGSAVMAGVISMVGRGLMTGAGPDDENEREEWLRLGYRPYSVKNPLNGEWVRYNRLEPTGMILGIASDIAEISRGMDKKDKTALENLNDAGILLLKSFAKNLGDKTFLRGITDFTQFYADPGRYGENYLSNMIATMAVPNILAQNARAMDPYMRDSRSMVDAVKARIPIVRESLPAKLDIAGQPIRGSKFEPFSSSAPVDDPLAEAMLRLGVKRGAPARDITVEKRKYEFTPEEYESYKGFMQQARWNVLTPYVNSPQFQRAMEVNSSAAGDQLGKVYDKIGTEAKEVWLIQHPEVIRKISQQSVKSSSASQYIQ
jgi:hypothetical protein